MSAAWPLEEDPKQMAVRLVEASKDSPEWLSAFLSALEAQTLGSQFRRTLDVWGLSASEAARLFGVSRQALSKWLTQGLPAERLETAANLAAAGDLLVHHLKPERISAVVRRKAPALGDRSLLDLVAAGDSAGALEACRAMFDFSATQG